VTEPPDRLTLTLEALPVEGWPASVRWRLLLKRLLRQLRIRCIRVEGTPREGPGKAAHVPQDRSEGRDPGSDPFAAGGP
jgi:hypothetical protein